MHASTPRPAHMQMTHLPTIFLFVTRPTTNHQHEGLFFTFFSPLIYIRNQPTSLLFSYETHHPPPHGCHPNSLSLSLSLTVHLLISFLILFLILIIFSHLYIIGLVIQCMKNIEASPSKRYKF